MKKIEKDYEYLETSTEALAHGLRRITRPKRLDAILNKKRTAKSRLTIYLDGAVVSHFKLLAEREGAGYQTLINDALRKLVDDEKLEAQRQDLKEELLKDKKFLKKLKVALSR